MSPRYNEYRFGAAMCPSTRAQHICYKINPIKAWAAVCSYSRNKQKQRARFLTINRVYAHWHEYGGTSLIRGGISPNGILGKR